jgi:nascent polypeptide-associated complex subunit beta
MEAQRRAQLQQIQKQVRTGGKGSVRRKVKAQRRPTGEVDEKKAIDVLRPLGLQQIPEIESVEMYRDNGTYLLFKHPKLHGIVHANTYDSHSFIVFIISTIVDLVVIILYSICSGCIPSPRSHC